MMEKTLEELILSVEPEKIIRITLSGKRNPASELNKAIIRRIENYIQIETFTDKQAFHKNIGFEELHAELLCRLTEDFRQMNAHCEGYDIDIRISKKGKPLYQKHKNDDALQNESSHNRKKKYILDEGLFVPALYELGVITKDGKIVASKYDKFKQINRFIELIDDALSDDGKQEFDIIDFGCGKSYLTFVLYYYMTEIRRKKVNITGLDLKRDVIEKCNDTAKKYGYSTLKFYCGDIKDYKPKCAPDMVVTLHACDTATDYALYNAISWGAKYIFSVPCCQHELNASLKSERLSYLTDHGLIKERFSALATDAIRSKILELYGYKTDILEFVDMDNSPKNMLIRAKKGKLPDLIKQKYINEKLESFTNEFGVELTLQKLIKVKKSEISG